MRAYEMGTQKGIQSLRLSDRPDPVAGPTQAAVRVRATALNHRDLMMMSGRYMGPKPENHIPLSDGAGEVIAVGEAVT
nr:alcohol dehydrogenase catalytic domain-containing protein [Planctomycetales bacterium]